MLFVRRVEGRSMQPTYRPGTIVFGLRWPLRPHVGSVVMADLHGREIIKRVGKSGQQGFFLLGDNTEYSSDSRTYGWFGSRTIKGVVIGSIHR